MLIKIQIITYLIRNYLSFNCDLNYSRNKETLSKGTKLDFTLRKKLLLKIKNPNKFI